VNPALQIIIIIIIINKQLKKRHIAKRWGTLSSRVRGRGTSRCGMLCQRVGEEHFPM
jgi:hypothetical protein